MRQFQVLDKAGRLNIVGVAQHEFLILRRGAALLAELGMAKGPVNERHAHGLALGMAEGETIAAGKLWRRLSRASELVDGLELGHGDRA